MTRWRRRARGAVLVAGWLLAAVACKTEKAPAIAGGPATAETIVSLTPNMTDILVALGRADRLVGVSRYDVEAIDGRRLPRVGGMLDPSVERIVSLRPALVLVHWDADEPPFAGQLRAAGIDVGLYRMRTLAELEACVLDLGRRLDAGSAAAQLVERLAPLLGAAPPLAADAPRALLMLGASPMIVAARDSFPAEVARRAGLRPLPEGAGPPYPRLSLEQARALAPHVVVDLVHGASAAVPDGLAGVPLARVDPDSLLRPGPRLLDGLTALRELASRSGAAR